MKSFVVMTYYQMMHAMAVALTLDEKPNLYIHENYLDIEEDFVERVKECGVFANVVGMNQKHFIQPFIEKLKKTVFMTPAEIGRIGSGIFDEYLEPYFAECFADADFNDDIYIYNDFQWYYYFVAKHFTDIIGVEDGYKTLKQQLEIHISKGHYQLTAPFQGKYYPEPLYRVPGIKKIISSCYFDDIDDYYREKLEVIDYAELVRKNEKAFGKALTYIFDLEDLDIAEKSVLYLTQPLDRAMYCSAIENYMLSRKIIDEQVRDGYHVYIKPHPAERLDYRMFESDDVTVLDGKFPIEVLDYKGVTFDKGITFGSTSIDTLRCIGERVEVSGGTSRGAKGVAKDIEEYIRGQEFCIDIFIKMYDQSDRSIYNIYSFLSDISEAVKVSVHVLIEEKNYDEYYFSLRRENARRAYRNSIRKVRFDERKILYRGEQRGVKHKIEDSRIDVLKVDDFKDYTILTAVSENVKGDYVLIMNSLSNGIEAKHAFYDRLEDNVYPLSVMVFHNMVEHEGKFITMDWNLTDDGHMIRFENIGINAGYIRNMAGKTADHVGWYPDFNSVKIIKVYNCETFLPHERYLDIYSGIRYYIDEAKKIADKSKNEFRYAALYMEFLNWSKIQQTIGNEKVNDNINMFLHECRMIGMDESICDIVLSAFVNDQMGDHNRKVYRNIDVYEYTKGAQKILIIAGIMRPLCFIWKKAKKMRDYLRDHYAEIKGKR